MAACTEIHNDMYHRYHSISSSGWGKKDTLTFTVYPIDSICGVNLYAEIRNTCNYPYSDLYLVIKQNIADSLKWQTDTVRFVLADSVGKWMGKGNGNYYQSAVYIRKIQLPPHPFHAVIKVFQNMKDDKLKGISDIGFRISYK